MKHRCSGLFVLLLLFAGIGIASATTVHTLTGADINGTDTISQINGALGGYLDAQDFGAVPSTTTETVTYNGTSTVTIGAIGDFANGEYVVVWGGGPTCSLTPPAVAVTPETTTTNSSNTDYTYEATVLCPNGGESAHGTPKTITNGNTALTATNWNVVSFAQASGTPYRYKIYGCRGASCTPTFVGLANTDSTSGGTTVYFADNGLYWNNSNSVFPLHGRRCVLRHGASRQAQDEESY